MFFETHQSIGRMIYERIDRLYPRTVHRSSFIYGNVKPDLMRKGSKDRHMLKDTLPYVKLTASFLKTLSVEPEEDDVSLGMIAHYACDAFCRYHSSVDLYSSYVRHLEYELGLNRYFHAWLKDGLSLTDSGLVADESLSYAGCGSNRLSLDDSCRLIEPVSAQKVIGTALSPFTGLVPSDASNNKIYFSGETLDEVKHSIDCLNHRQESYFEAEPSFALDIVYALEASVHVIDAIIRLRQVFIQGRPSCCLAPIQG